MSEPQPTWTGAQLRERLTKTMSEAEFQKRVIDLNEIKKRHKAAERDELSVRQRSDISQARVAFLEHAWRDIAVLLDEIERLKRENFNLSRIVSQQELDAQEVAREMLYSQNEEHKMEARDVL